MTLSLINLKELGKIDTVQIKIKVCVIFLAILSTPIYGKNLTNSSSIGFQTQIFPEKSTNLRRENYSNNISLSIDTEIEYLKEENKFFFHLFGRADQHDSHRSHIDLREGYYQYLTSNFDLTVGITKVFWGVTESVHLVDVINQTDWLEDIDGEDKLGQPMVRLNIFNEWGDVSVFMLPYFRKRSYFSRFKRLSSALPMSSESRFEKSHASRNIDYAFRYQNYFDNFDIGISHFRGTNREPIISISGDRLLANYFSVTRNALDMQYTLQSWLFKLEILNQRRLGRNYYASVGGFEHTVYGINGRNDLGFLLEYQYDDRDTTYLPTTFSDDDIFIGFRYSINDANDTVFLLGGVQDLEDRTTTYSFEAETRLKSNWKAEVTARVFSNVDPKNSIYSLNKDDFIKIEITNYF